MTSADEVGVQREEEHRKKRRLLGSETGGQLEAEVRGKRMNMSDEPKKLRAEEIWMYSGAVGAGLDGYALYVRSKEVC